MNQCYEVFHLTLCILCTPCKHLLSMKNCCLVAWNFSICGIIWKHFQNMSSNLLFSTGLKREFILSIDVPLVFWKHIDFEVKRGHCIERTCEGQRRKKSFLWLLFSLPLFLSLCSSRWSSWNSSEEWGAWVCFHCLWHIWLWLELCLESGRDIQVQWNWDW